MGRPCNTYRKKRNIHKILTGKPEGQNIFGRPSGCWKSGINIHLNEIGAEDEDSVHQTQDRNQ